MSASNRIRFPALLIHLYLAISPATTHTTYYLNSTVEFNPEYLQDLRVVISSDKMSVDIFLNLDKDCTKPKWIAVIVDVQNRKTKSYRNLFHYEDMMCNIVGGNSASWLSRWVNNFYKWSSAPVSCPLGKGNYSWRDMKLESVSIPDLFVGKYRLTVSSYLRKASIKEMVANVRTIFQLK